MFRKIITDDIWFRIAQILKKKNSIDKENTGFDNHLNKTFSR